ncbi:alcohol dehydrogenase [Meiothermus hypogaeus NBRC 106114]|uniref:Alcohol dehydrogenase n=3 Tax=Meiothermus hypogaeus TaxID=884155 RepID=A0A511R4R6_9DEIN|nr:Galactitol-1-phosphate 5-dehydrogenase [Meiothermus hypogaeus]GEM84006.1 alcohol dehydrogenase [Meiothermus hypogaeus NBRC 106114]
MQTTLTVPAQSLTRQSAGAQVLMRGLLFTPSIPRYVAAKLLGKRYPPRALSLQLTTLPEPERPPGFERLKVRLAGICGSDLALLYGKQAPTLSGMFSFPAVLGHEILAELGGVRVVVNPVLACLERGLPDCPACARGDDHLCFNVAEGNLGPGMVGFCRDLGGGWAQRMVAHRERIFPIDEQVPDERAVLTEPAAVVLHGLRQAWGKSRLPTEFRPGPEGSYLSTYSMNWPAEMLVVGAGTIGLLTIKMLRVLGFEGPLFAVARHPRQAELAQLLGANQIFPSTQAAQQAAGARRYRGILGATSWRGGFEGVVEASGSPAGLQEATWAVREGGRVLLLGAPATAFHDFSPYWFREIGLIGSYAYSWDDFAQTVKLLPEMKGIEAMVTHRFGLEAWPEAIKAAVTRRGIKVVFKP